MGSFGRLLIMSGALVLVASAAQAQEIAGNFDQLRVLVKPGDTVQIKDNTGQEIRGQVLDLSPAAIRIRRRAPRATSRRPT
jgi:hypothetical protein